MFKLFLFLHFAFFTSTPPKYTVAAIPKTLLENADQVVRDEAILIDISSSKKMSRNEMKAVTYFGKKKTEIPFTFFYSKEHKIKNIELTIFDQAGQIIEKFSKKDFKDRSATFGSSFVTDDRVLYLVYKPKQFPVTIEVQSKTESSTTAFLGSWNPIDDYQIACQKSSITINCQKALGLKYLLNNITDAKITHSELEGGHAFEVKEIPAIKKESMCPKIEALAPNVKFALNQFTLEGYAGTANDWKEMGQWYHENLLKAQGNLGVDAKTDIDNLLKGVTNDLDKAKLIYQYVQQRSRYVSIQLGIGGWKPFSADTVHESGYSDCKGLTNYTQALMEYAGINANYAVIYAGDDMTSIEPDFCSLQGNHVILCLPDLPQNDTTWLECTSQNNPFGYIGAFTDNRTAWVINEKGGAVCYTKQYSAEENLKYTKATFSLSDDGHIEGEMTSQYSGLFFSNFLYDVHLKKEELIKHQKSSLKHLPKLSIKNYQSTINKDDIIFTDSFQLQSAGYGLVGTDEMILQVNIINRIEELPKRYRSRQHAFEIKRGKKYVDQFDIKISDHYKLSNPIEDKIFETEFGTYKFTTKFEHNVLKCERQLLLKNGKFPKEKYNDYRDFYKKIKNADQQKIRIINK